MEYDTEEYVYSPEIEELESRLRQSGEVMSDVDRQQIQELVRMVEKDAKLFQEKRVKNPVKDIPFVAKTTESKERRISFELTQPHLTEALSTCISLDTPKDSRTRMKLFEGGIPITFEQADELRRLVSNSTVHPLCSEWMKAGFLYQRVDGPFPYGLHIQKNCARGIQMVVQAHIVKNLLFYRDRTLDPNIVSPTSLERRDALVTALSEILWRAGSKEKCCIALLHDTPCYPTTAQHWPDGVTERVHLFYFSDYESLEEFVKKYMNYFEFESTHGCVLLMYSVILSRTTKRILLDAGATSCGRECTLLNDREGCTIALINLLLTGCASRYLHNGKVAFDDRGDALPTPLLGVQGRSDLGFLYWNEKEDKKCRTQVGSMLKTPRYPVWVTSINGYYSLLFNVHKELTSDWRFEHLFFLHYYTGLPSQVKSAKLTIDTRFGRSSTARTAIQKNEEEKRVPPLEWCIMTKWPDAEIDWNDTRPFI